MTIFIPSVSQVAKLKICIGLLVIALVACLYQLHVNSVQLKEDTIILKLCFAGGGSLASPTSLPLHKSNELFRVVQ